MLGQLNVLQLIRTNRYMGCPKRVWYMYYKPYRMCRVCVCDYLLIEHYICCL